MTEKFPSWLTASDIVRPSVDCVEDPDTCAQAYFKAYADKLYDYLCAVFGCPQDAEDVVQETFQRFHRKLMEHQSIDNPRAWIFTVARNRMINLLVQYRNQAMTRDQMARDPTLNRDVPTPEHLLAEQQLHDAVNAAVSHLPELVQHCVHLRRQGLKICEIAPLVGMDPRRVSELIKRAIVALQGHLRD